MSNNEKSKISNKSQQVITYFGYWWVSFSVIYGIIQLVTFSFNISVTFWWVGLIILSAVLLITSLIAFLFVKLFPNILDKIFNKLPEDKKYYDIPVDEQLSNLKEIIYSSLCNSDNDESLLASLKSCIENSDDESLLKARNITFTNSSLFHRLGKEYVRVLNGLYSLLVLSKLKSKSLIKEYSREYVYRKNYILINDLGWSLTKLTDLEWDSLIDIIDNDNNPELKKVNSLYNVIDKNHSQCINAVNNIYSALSELEQNKKSYAKLLAQAIRHLINIDFTNADINASNPRKIKTQFSDSHSLLINLENVIKLIRNDDDRNEMWGHYYYINAIKKIKISSTAYSYNKMKELEEADKFIKKAKNCFANFKNVDEERLLKCLNVEATIFINQADINKTENEKLISKAITVLEEALNKAKKLMRYDQVLRNLKTLVEICPNEKAIQYAKEGFITAEILRNETYKKEFLKYYKPKHIILIRHGESDKNLDKIINGEGHLTESGSESIVHKAEQIKKYLNKYNYKEIKIYGHSKLQVNETIQLISKTLKISAENCIYSDLLKPTDMGILRCKSETDNSLKESLTILDKWRNHTITIEELTETLNAERAIDFWQRANQFIENICDNECSIIVCTTSIAILLAHYLTDSEYNSQTYCHINVPLGGIIHFVKSANKSGYELVNKEAITNINFSSIE